MSEDKEWIKELKAGDKVFVRKGFDDSDMNVRIVKRITPKGAVRLADNTLFKDGVYNSSTWSPCQHLLKYSEEKVAEIQVVRARRGHVRKLENVRWGHLKPELVDAVYGMLNEAGVFDE